MHQPDDPLVAAEARLVQLGQRARQRSTEHHPAWHWALVAAAVISVALGSLDLVLRQSDRSTDAARNKDAVVACDQAKDPRHNILCIVGNELDVKSKSRDAKEAQLAAGERRDLCSLLTAFSRSGFDVRAVSTDFGCTPGGTG